MRCYIVGGAIRDELLGLPVKDRDWVVVGETPESMLAQGFHPVGQDFPVFLHPQTHEEYALARTERKTGQGYAGFTFHTSPDVTLEDDLVRRDLTINAIARAEDGTLVDPFGGCRDLEARIFRHVGPAFAEDPVRILRLARFAARYPEFGIAPETMTLMQKMVAEGETDHLVAERVWQEIARGLMERKPSRMIRVLRQCGALARLLPELDCLFGIPQPAQYHPEIDTGEHVLLVIDKAAEAELSLPVRWACLLHDLGKGLTPADTLPHHYGHEESGAPLADNVSQRLKAPVQCRELAVLVAREHGRIGRFDQLRAGTLVDVLERCDAFRRPERFLDVLDACACDHLGRGETTNNIWPPAAGWRRALEAARGVDAAQIARNTANKADIPLQLHQARAEAVRRHLP